MGTETKTLLLLIDILFFNLSCSNTGTPQDCLKGTFSPSGQLTCEDCQEGHTCPTVGLAAAQLCINGTYQNSTKQTTCLSCPAGYMCSSVDVDPVACSDGKYSLLGMNECLTCPAGHR